MNVFLWFLLAWFVSALALTPFICIRLREISRECDEL
jgi:hypothetical protein